MTPPWPLWIEITPSPASITDEGSIQLTAIGHMSDGGTLDMTRGEGAVVFGDESTYAAGAFGWASEDISIAEVNNGLTQGGLVFGVGPGTIQIGGLWTSIAAVGVVPDPPGTIYDFEPTPHYAPEDGLPGQVVGVADLIVTSAPPVPDPEGRFLLAFDSPSLQPNPTWTRLDSIPNLVTSYSIDRGRAYELDRTDTGRATVQIADPDGILDPTNPEGLYFGKIRPLLQAAIGRYNPVSEEWKLRYRGFVEDFDYVVDPSQKLNWLVLSLVDLFEVLSGVEMQPGQFGSLPPPGSEGQVYFPDDHKVDLRIIQTLSNAGISKKMRVVIAGSVLLHKAVYSPGSSPLAAIQEAADGEFPAVANVYCDRRGRICFHGRQAKFHPDEVAAEVGIGAWDYHEWRAGDGAAVAASPSDTAQLRELAFNRGLSKLINSASASPVEIADEVIVGQLVVDATAIGTYGIRSWSANDLLTKQSLLDDSSDLVETKRFATYYVANYAAPRDRVTGITLRSLHPDDARATATWELLNTIDIADSVDLSAGFAGGGGIGEQYFVEGIHEDVRPLDPDYDDVTLRLDLSPRAFFASNPWTP